METKILSQKDTSVARKIPCRRLKNKKFCEAFSEFAKGSYETWDCNFFNLALVIVVVFSILQFILFLHFASNN